MVRSEDHASEDATTFVEQPPIHGACIVLAGPGTGKTTLLTERVLHVLRSTPTERSKILALTFTNRAAAEMRTRLRAHGNQPDSRLFVGTFHSFAAHVLRSHGDAIGLNSDFVIFDRDDQKSVLEDLRDDGELNEGINIDSVLSAFSSLKSRGEQFSNLWPNEQTTVSEGLVLIHDKYRSRLERSNALDFGDLITECLRLFASNQGIQNLYRTAYPYVLVDEFQDTTPAQFDLLKAITDPSVTNVFAVADEDQLIFEWNEARLETLNLYLDHFRAEITYSTLSHRCPPVVVEAANAVIANNRLRLLAKPAIHTKSGERGTLFIHRADTEQSEANFVATKIQELRVSGLPLSEIAIIARNRRCLRMVGPALDSVPIPAGQPSTAGLSGDEDGQAVLRLLRWLLNPRDEQSARRLVQYLKPSSSELFDELVRSGLRQGLSLEAALAEAPDSAEGDQVRGLLANVISLRLLVRDTLKLIQALKTDMPKWTEDPHREVGLLDALDTMEKLLGQVSNSPRIRLSDFLSSLPVVVGPRVEGIDSETGAVSILTFHQAKGLEFTSVFLMGLVDGIFPDFRSINGARTLEEERRLFYVGLTRSRRDVFLSLAAQRTTTNSRVVPCEESRFIDEIPTRLLTYV